MTLSEKSRAFAGPYQFCLPIACVTLCLCGINTCITDTFICLLALRHCLINLERVLLLPVTLVFACVTNTCSAVQ